MTVEVQLPDGSIAEFPDTMSDAEIEAAVRSHLQLQPSTPAPAEPPPQASDDPKVGDRLLRAAGIGPTVHNIVQWALANPQLALEMLIQGGTTSAGVAAGTPFGPAGQAILGGLGSVAGKRVARDVGRFLGLPGETSQPDLASAETALDAAIGASGPALSVAVRPLSRAALGISRPALTRVREAVDKATDAAKDANLMDQLAEVGRTSGRHREFARRLETEAVGARVEAHKASAERAQVAEIAAEEAGKAGRLAEAIANYGGIAAAAARGDLSSAAVVFGLGHSLSAGQKAAARKLLQNDDVVRWLTDKGAVLSATGQSAAILPLLATEKWLSSEDRSALKTLQGDQPKRRVGGRVPVPFKEQEPQSPPGPDPFSGERRRRGMPQRHSLRGPDGKFRAATIDRTQLEELFGKGPFG